MKAVGQLVQVAPPRCVFRRGFDSPQTQATDLPAPYFTPTTQPLVFANLDLSQPIGTHGATGTNAQCGRNKNGFHQYVSAARSMLLIPRGKATMMRVVPVVNGAPGQGGTLALGRIHKGVFDLDDDAANNVGAAIAATSNYVAFFNVGGFEFSFLASANNAFGGSGGTNVIGNGTLIASTAAEVAAGNTPIPPDGWFYSNLNDRGSAELAIDGHGCDFFLLLLKNTTATSVNVLIGLE